MCTFLCANTEYFVFTLSLVTNPPLPPVYLNIQEVNTFSTFQVQSEEHIAETEHTSDYYTNQ